MPKSKVARNIDKDYICLNCKIGKHNECKKVVSIKYETVYGIKTRNKACKCLCKELDYKIIEAIVSVECYEIECSICDYLKWARNYDEAREILNNHFDKTSHAEVTLRKVVF